MLPHLLPRPAGLENLAISPDGKTAMAMLQSGMGDDNASPYKYSFVLTAVMLDISNWADPKLLGVYLYVGECRGWPSFVMNVSYGSWAILTGPIPSC